MSSKLISSGGYGCVYYPSINCSGNKTNKKNSVTKIQIADQSADNEVNISKIIKKIPMYSKHFVPVISHCPLKIKELKDDIVKECDVISKKKDVMLMELNYIRGITFDDYLLNSENERHAINTIISSYTYLLNALHILNKNNIIHFDLKGNNIMYNTEKNIPLVIDFGLSIDLENIDMNKLDNYFFTYSPSYYIWCPEIHFLCYIVNVNDKVNKNDIQKICNDIISNNKALNKILSKSFIKKYIDSMISYYSQFINMEKKNIIKILLETSHTWDNYSLSNIYIKIISKIYSSGFTKNSFISKFIELLLNTITPNPNKRYGLNKCVSTFENIISKGDYTAFKNVVDSLKINKHNFKDMIKKEKKVMKTMKTDLVGLRG